MLDDSSTFFIRSCWECWDRYPMVCPIPLRLLYPIGSMYGIYANIGGILMANVTIYSIHGSYGYCLSMCLILSPYKFPAISLRPIDLAQSKISRLDTSPRHILWLPAEKGRILTDCPDLVERKTRTADRCKLWIYARWMATVRSTHHDHPIGWKMTKMFQASQDRYPQKCLEFREGFRMTSHSNIEETPGPIHVIAETRRGFLRSPDWGPDGAKRFPCSKWATGNWQPRALAFGGNIVQFLFGNWQVKALIAVVWDAEEPRASSKSKEPSQIR